MKHALAVALLAGLVPCWLGAAESPEMAARVEVEILEPAAGVPLFDEVEIAARVRSPEPLAEVAFFVDGRQVGVVHEPPFSLRVDVGGENREHRIRVVARGLSGAVGEGELVAPALRIDERVGLELQQLYASVTSRFGRRILDLEQGDFTVYDEGIEQQIVTFSRGELPLAAVLLVDSSGSMKGERLEGARRGAHAFLGGLQPLDEARLVVFSDRIVQSGPFSMGPPAEPQALAALETRGGSAINDHLYLALQLLENRQGRRVVVLLSDGRDNHSVLRIDQVREVARRSQAIVYWARLQERGVRGGRPEPRSTWRDQREARRELKGLEDTVRESGGRIFTLSRAAEIEPAFRVILAELREQYALGYYPSPRRDDGSWRRVRLEIGVAGLKVRTREGYYDR